MLMTCIVHGKVATISMNPQRQPMTGKGIYLLTWIKFVNGPNAPILLPYYPSRQPLLKKENSIYWTMYVDFVHGQIAIKYSLKLLHNEILNSICYMNILRAVSGQNVITGSWKADPMPTPKIITAIMSNVLLARISLLGNQ